MSNDLFRKEVMEARRASWLGGISLAQPLRLWVLTLAGMTAAGAIIAFLLLGTYTRRSSVTGQLVTAKGLATVLAPLPAWSVAWIPTKAARYGRGRYWR